MRALLAVLVVTVGAPLAAQERGPEVPTALFLHYNCKPDKRAAFRTHMEGPGVAQFDNWKKQGVFKDYLILFSTFANPVWDMLVRLDFEKYVDTDRWRAIERTTPGGPFAPGARPLLADQRPSRRPDVREVAADS